MGMWRLVSRHPQPWYYGRTPVIDPGDGRWELYDLQADRAELNYLAAKDPKRVAAMKAAFDRWAAGCAIPEWDSSRRA